MRWRTCVFVTMLKKHTHTHTQTQTSRRRGVYLVPTTRMLTSIVSRMVTNHDCGKNERDTQTTRYTSIIIYGSSVMPRDWRQRHRRRQVATRKPRANDRRRMTGRRAVCTLTHVVYTSRARCRPSICRTSSVRSTKRCGVVAYTPA